MGPLINTRLDVVAGGSASAAVAPAAIPDAASAAPSAAIAHGGMVVWLTGLSGAGKSTLAIALQQRLTQRGMRSHVLDGDRLRVGLNQDLGFSEADRTENVRRVGEVAALFADAGVIAIVALISPYAAARLRARSAAFGRFCEVYVKASLDACAVRDPKGLYARARRGELAEFTGISAPYEIPAAPDVVLDTEADDVRACVERLVRYVDGALAV
jgi:bifunctional enzyme CysN/CysC